MKKQTVIYSGFKQALENCPSIKVVEVKNQFNPPSESRKRAGMAELREAGFEVEDWIGDVIGLSKGNSISYHIIRDRKNRGEGSFSLNDPQEFLVEAEPWLAKSAKQEADRPLFNRLRVIDQPNVAQTFAAVVMEAGSPPKLPQQVVFVRKGTLLPMDLVFRDYYAALPEFMGILNWQLLYTAADPQGSEHKADFEQLRNSYDDLKQLFPSRNFSVWAEKLAKFGLI